MINKTDRTEVKPSTRIKTTATRKIQTEISVSTVFSGKQDEQQAFIDLILHKRRADYIESKIDAEPHEKYNQNKVFSDVHVV